MRFRLLLTVSAMMVLHTIGVAGQATSAVAGSSPSTISDSRPNISSWTPIVAGNGSEYIAVVNKSGPIATIWDVINFAPTPIPADSGGPTASSMIAKIDVDCGAMRWRELYGVFTTDDMGRGAIVAADSAEAGRGWVMVPPGDRDQINQWCRAAGESVQTPRSPSVSSTSCWRGNTYDPNAAPGCEMVNCPYFRNGPELVSRRICEMRLRAAQQKQKSMDRQVACLHLQGIINATPIPMMSREQAEEAATAQAYGPGGVVLRGSGEAAAVIKSYVDAIYNGELKVDHVYDRCMKN